MQATNVSLGKIKMQRVLLEHTDMYLTAHDEDKCLGEVCSLHRRSDHHMRGFPQNWRGDRYLMERTCPHGVGHPDPDDFRIRNGQDSGIHGCDGCCSKPEDLS